MDGRPANLSFKFNAENFPLPAHNQSMNHASASQAFLITDHCSLQQIFLPKIALKQ
jgi:hypothetical protein